VYCIIIAYYQLAKPLVSVPVELKKEMDQFSDVNWSEAIRQMLAEKIRRLETLKRLDELLKDSKLTEKDAIRLGRKVNRSMRKRLEEKGLL